MDVLALIRNAAQNLNLLSAEGELVPSMDSLDMVNLFVELETALGRPIPPEMVSPETFQSVSALADALNAVASK